MISNPLLAVDGMGRVHIVVRAFYTQGGGYDNQWSLYMATMTEDGWTEPVQVPYSEGRLSMFAAATPSEDGGLWLAWPRDNNLSTSIFINLPEETIIENVYAARFAPDTLDAGAKLGSLVEPDFPSRPGSYAEEDADVAAIRSWRSRAAGTNLQILRGDTHRHTELSPDLRAVPDGSALDFYRYMLDAAAMDFGFISDHQYGGDREYWWWYTEKLADHVSRARALHPALRLRALGELPERPPQHHPRPARRRAVPFFLNLERNPARPHNGMRPGHRRRHQVRVRGAAEDPAASPSRTPRPPSWAPTGGTTIPRSSRWSSCSRATAAATSTSRCAALRPRWWRELPTSITEKGFVSQRLGQGIPAGRDRQLGPHLDPHLLRDGVGRGPQPARRCWTP